MAACYVPFNNKDMDLSFFVFRPKVIFVDEFIELLKQFSLCTESLGCVQSSVFKSIHGNMIIWYGEWMKKCAQDKELLTTKLLSMLNNTSTMAILVEHTFFHAYAGESKDGTSTAKFTTGDIISMNVIAPSSGDLNDLSYANLAIFKSRFLKMEGANSGVCLKCLNEPRVASFYVWKSLQFCYSWILNSDFRKTMLPYLEKFCLSIRYDVFLVVYVSGESVLDYGCIGSMLGLENVDAKEERQIMSI